MRAEQKPQLMKGRLVRVTKTATRCPQTGQGAVPSSGMAGLSSIGSFPCSESLLFCSMILRPKRLNNSVPFGLSLSMRQRPSFLKFAVVLAVFRDVSLKAVPL